jgi:hypothetical protein
MNEPGEGGRVGCTIVTPATETRLSTPYRGYGHSPELGIEAAHWFCIHSRSAQVCEQAVSQGCVIEDDRGAGTPDGA